MNNKNNERLTIRNMVIKNIIIIVLIGFTMLSCSKYNRARYQILECLESPDKAVNAIMVRESAGGATGSFYYSVYILPHKQNKQSKLRISSIKKKKKIFYANHVSQISLTWRENRCLEIIYKKATIKFFTNYWINNLYVVETRLKPLTEWSLGKENFLLTK